MSSPFPQDDLSVFTEALALRGKERVRFLDQLCGDDVSLRERVESLLRAHEKAGRFLDQPPPDHPGYPSAQAPVGEKPGDQIDRYRLLQMIGEGGCGVVFMAEQLHPVQRRVALKIIKPGMDTKSVIARFEAERQVLALMDHPNIAKVFDAGATESGRPYFVMELIRGRKITEYCDEHELSTRDRLQLVIQVCHAIQHAHQKGIIHRDIKPSNILVTRTEEGMPLPVIIDFGIAKATNNQTLTDKTLFTAFEQFLGTPAYMSPEQAALTNLDVDTRSDIYSMGVMLYELLTGSTPFNATELFKSGLDEIRRVIREVEPARPSTRLSGLKAEELTSLAQRRRVHPPELVRSLQGDLDWIVMKALDKDRSRRYQSAGGFAADLERCLANEAVTARPPSAAYKLQKFAQRNKLLCISLGTILFLIMTSLVVILHSLGEEREARKQAQTEEARSRQTTRFLKSMLEGVGPSVARGRDTVMLREILDRTAGEISHTLGDQPAVEGEMRAFMARLYLDVGNYEASESMARSALELHSKLWGSNHVDTASDLNDLGAALLKRRHLAEAEGVTLSALRIRGALLGSNHVDVASSLTQLGAIRRRLKRLDSAEELTRQGLEIRRNQGGDESLEVADSLRNLSIILVDVGRRAEAEKTAREMLALRRRLLGNEHPLVATALADLAWILGTEAHPREAEELETEAFEIQMKVLPQEHPDTAKSIYSIGERLRARGKWTESQSVLTAALSIQRKLLGDDHPDVLATLLGLAQTLEHKGDWATSESIREELLQLTRKRHGDHSPQALEAWNSLIEAVRIQNRLDRAEQHLNALLTDSFRTNPASARFLALRGNIHGRQGRWNEVIPDASQAAKLQPEEHYHFHTLATVLVATDSKAEYEALCTRIMSQADPSPNPYISDRIARALTLWPGNLTYAKEADTLADSALVYGGKTQDAPLFQLTKSLVAYRLGQYSESREWSEKASSSLHPYIRAQAQCMLVMNLRHAQRMTEAQLMWAKAQSLLPLLQHARTTGDFGDDWILGMQAWLLWRETARMMGEPADHVTIP